MEFTRGINLKREKGVQREISSVEEVRNVDLETWNIFRCVGADEKVTRRVFQVLEDDVTDGSV